MNLFKLVRVKMTSPLIIKLGKICNFCYGKMVNIPKKKSLNNSDVSEIPSSASCPKHKSSYLLQGHRSSLSNHNN